MFANASNPSTGGPRDLCVFGVSLTCKMSSRTAKADCLQQSKQKRAMDPTLGMVAQVYNGEAEAGKSLQVRNC